MPKYDLYNFDINSDVIILYFAASFNCFHQITMIIQKDFHENDKISSKNQLHNFWV